jgi:two-component sensor histidine kinase/CheY-like chemotaxis protein
MKSLFPKKAVLVIDDEDQTLRSIETILKMDGINNVVSCGDSREVTGLLRERKFSVVLLDLSMPHVSGFEILAFIHKNHPDLPVIIMTASAELDSAIVCMNLGVDDYLNKPIDKQRLLDSLGASLDRKNTHSENRLLKEILLSDKFMESDDKKIFHKTREEYKRLFNNTILPQFVMDANSFKILFFNKAFAEFFGISDQHSSDENVLLLDDLLPKQECRRLLIALATDGSVTNHEIDGKDNRDINFTISLSCRFSKKDGCVEGCFIDITKNKQQSQKLEAIINEKIILSHELDHRVNNNLQLILSLLNLQLDAETDNKIAGVLQKCISRIQAMTLVNKMISSSNSYTDVDAGRFVRSIVYSIIETFGLYTLKVNVHNRIESTFLITPEHATALGLALNELLTYMFRAGFSEGENDEFTIEISWYEGYKINIGIYNRQNSVFELLLRELNSGVDVQLAKWLIEGQLQGRLSINTGENAGCKIVLDNIVRSWIAHDHYIARDRLT